METRQELVSLGKTDDSRPIVVGTRVFDKLLTTNAVVDFSKKKYHFLQLRRREVPLAEAALKLNIPLDEATRFENSQQAQEYLRDRELSSILAEEAKDSDRFWVRVNAILEGQIPATKAQIEALKIMHNQVSPRGEAHGGTSKIEIHITAGSVQEAFRRNEVIEAEIVKGHEHAA